MPEKNNVKKNNATESYESEEIRRLNEYIDEQYSTSQQTLPALRISEVLDPKKLESARKVYNQVVNPDPKDEDIMDESGTTRKEMRDMYTKGIPPASVRGLDKTKPVKHTIDVYLENGKPVIEVGLDDDSVRSVIIAEPPSNDSAAEGSSTDFAAGTAPKATTAFATEKETENREWVKKLVAVETEASDATKMTRGEEFDRSMKTGTARPTVAATPVPAKPASSPSDVPTDENNVETK